MNCPKEDKVKLVLRDAKALVRRCVELHHYYKCDYCGTYHVSSRESKLKGFKSKIGKKK